MRIRSILSVAVLAGNLTLFCQPAQAAVSVVRQDAALLTDVVEYECVTTGVVEKQDVKIRIELTMPADAMAGEQMTIGWRGSYVDDIAVLRVPATGLADGTKLYAYASFSGIDTLTSATGVGELAMPGAGEVVPLPAAVLLLRTKSSNTGTATVHPAAINFGTRPGEPSIQCRVQNRAALTAYTLTVASAGGLPADSVPVTPSPRPTPAPTATADDQSTGSDSVASNPRPTHTAPATVARAVADGNGKVMKTPSGAAATGGGGESGPDGRVLVLTGFLLTLTAATGLLLRRRGLSGG